MSTIVRFNIGGFHHEVSRSLLNRYPDSMLNIISSSQWQKNPDSEIFIERDGSRFKFCLDYLRDAKCNLPLTVSRDAVIEDLFYYGIIVPDDKTIKYFPSLHTQRFQAFKCTRVLLLQLKTKIFTLSKTSDVDSVHQHQCYFVVRKFLCQYIESGKMYYCFNLNAKTAFDERLHNCLKKRAKMLDECLQEYGLKLNGFGFMENNHTTEFDLGWVRFTGN